MNTKLLDQAIKTLESVRGALGSFAKADVDLTLGMLRQEKETAQPEQEPVATMWQHGETGRTRITMPGDITDCDARWFKVSDLYTTPPPVTEPHKRKPLLASDIVTMYDENPRSDSEMIEFARAIEAAHGIYAPTELKE